MLIKVFQSGNLALLSTILSSKSITAEICKELMNIAVSTQHWKVVRMLLDFVYDPQDSNTKSMMVANLIQENELSDMDTPRLSVIPPPPPLPPVYQFSSENNSSSKMNVSKTVIPPPSTESLAALTAAIDSLRSEIENKKLTRKSTMTNTSTRPTTITTKTTTTITVPKLTPLKKPVSPLSIPSSYTMKKNSKTSPPPQQIIAKSLARTGFFAVRVGRVPGIYSSFNKALDQVLYYHEAEWCRFDTEELAKSFFPLGTSFIREDNILKPIENDFQEASSESSNETLYEMEDFIEEGGFCII